MTQTICRMYGSNAQATKAADALGALNYSDVHVIGGEGASPDEVLSALYNAHVLNAHASVYARKIQKGGSLVVAHTLLGRALKARDLLDSMNPVNSGVVEPVAPKYLYDEKFPASSSMRLPVLAKNALPAEKLMGLRSVTKSPQYFSKLIGIGMIAKSSKPPERRFGMKSLAKSGPLFTKNLK